MIDYLEARKLIEEGFEIQAIERHCGSDNFVSYYHIKNNKFFEEWNRITPWGNDGKSSSSSNNVSGKILNLITNDGREYYAHKLK